MILGVERVVAWRPLAMCFSIVHWRNKCGRKLVFGILLKLVDWMTYRMSLGIWGRLKKLDFELFCILAWVLWWEQNIEVHGRHSRNVGTQTESAISLLEEIKRASTIHLLARHL